MNNKAINFIKNFSYSVSSNLISLIISIIVVLIVPKLLGIQEYGYWQLYLFYTSYVGFLHFGWNDGIYLRYGGKEYKDLDMKLFFSQFWTIVIVQSLIGFFILLFSELFVSDSDKKFIFNMLSIGIILVNVRYMLIYILQGTNRIKEYAQIIMLEKILYCLLILFLLTIGIRQFKLLVVADILGKTFSLAFSVYCCRNLVIGKFSFFYFSIKEAFVNIRVGIKLMFANIASILIIGVVRFGIERAWDVSTFGKVSLTLSVSNLMMIFTNAVGMILFPVLKRMDSNSLTGVYKTMRTFLMVPLLGLLIVFFPLKEILLAWLPQYSESLMYMAFLFPICVYEGKMAMLINTYLKALRQEKQMLLINLAAVCLSITFTILFTIVYKNLSLVILAIVGLLAFRCIITELFLSKKLQTSVSKDILLESIMTLMFILTGWFMSFGFGFMLYLLIFSSYLLIKRRDIISSYLNLKEILKS